MTAVFLSLAFLLASPAIHFDVTDARGKSTGIVLEADAPDSSGWSHVSEVKAKGKPVLVWPMEAMAAPPDGPESVPAIVIQHGDPKALANPHVVAAIATPVVLGIGTIDSAAQATGFDALTLAKAFSALATGAGMFERGVGLLYTGRAADAADALTLALRERQRQLTRVPSEIYPLALLCGQALMAQNKFDAAAVEFAIALKQRPGDERAHKARNEALVKAGKPEAAQ
jgi:hypothetical protein